MNDAVNYCKCKQWSGAHRPHGTCGVYAIRHKVLGHMYVGSSACVVGRWVGHLKRLEAGVSDHPLLQEAWNRHGRDSFEFVILATTLHEERVAAEKRFIRLHNSEYNSAHTLDANPKLIHEARLRRMAQRQGLQLHRSPVAIPTRSTTTCNCISSPEGNAVADGMTLDVVERYLTRPRARR